MNKCLGYWNLRVFGLALLFLASNQIVIRLAAASTRGKAVIIADGNSVSISPKDFVPNADYIIRGELNIVASGSISIGAEHSFVVEKSGKVSLHAHSSIWIGSGFIVENGASYSATIDDAPTVAQTETISMNQSGLSTNADSPFPTTYALHDNYPNPFNPSTRISYDLPEQTHVRLIVFNSLGQEIVALVNEIQAAGYKTVEFDAGNLPSGFYIYQFQSSKFIAVKKMILLK
jgi:hypothetical protein